MRASDPFHRPGAVVRAYDSSFGGPGWHVVLLRVYSNRLELDPGGHLIRVAIPLGI